MISGKMGIDQQHVGEEREDAVGEPAEVGGRDADEHATRWPGRRPRRR